MLNLVGAAGGGGGRNGDQHGGRRGRRAGGTADHDGHAASLGCRRCSVLRKRLARGGVVRWGATLLGGLRTTMHNNRMDVHLISNNLDCVLLAAFGQLCHA